MIKNLIIYTILSSMTLHCGVRLGFLDQLYQQRHKIAYNIGLIAEIPIALCNSDYDFDKGLKIENHEADQTALPISSIAQEIILFSPTQLSFTFSPQELLAGPFGCNYSFGKYFSPYADIFHPPCLCA